MRSEEQRSQALAGAQRPGSALSRPWARCVVPAWSSVLGSRGVGHLTQHHGTVRCWLIKAFFLMYFNEGWVLDSGYKDGKRKVPTLKKIPTGVDLL